MQRSDSDSRQISASAFHILLALADREQHGAAITAEVAQLTGGAIRLTPGGLYRYLKEMTADGWIAESGGDSDDGRLRVYRLMPRGRRIAQAEAARMESLVRISRERRLLPVRA